MEDVQRISSSNSPPSYLHVHRGTGKQAYADNPIHVTNDRKQAQSGHRSARIACISMTTNISLQKMHTTETQNGRRAQRCRSLARQQVLTFTLPNGAPSTSIPSCNSTQPAIEKCPMRDVPSTADQSHDNLVSCSRSQCQVPRSHRALLVSQPYRFTRWKMCQAFTPSYMSIILLFCASSQYARHLNPIMHF